jgi:hypothetical protein
MVDGCCPVSLVKVRWCDWHLAMDQRGPWAREGSMQVINASAEGWMQEGALGPWSGRRRWRWIGHGEVCGQQPAFA